jgi:aminoglycoside phosphotransferase (APT) family kinase protein
VCALAADDAGNLPAEFADPAEWLRHHAPEESGAAIVHNDFRLGNMMVARNCPGRVAAVLDWELATIGDPLFDLGYFLSSYPQGNEPLTPTSRMGTAVFEDGYPTRTELLDRYCARTHAQPEAVTWYAALAQFKLAALYEYGRRRADTAGGDPYYADPGQVSSFLAAAESLAT